MNPYMYEQYSQPYHLFSYLLSNGIYSFTCEIQFIAAYNNTFCNLLFDVKNVKDKNNNIININIPLETKIYVNGFNCYMFNDIYNNLSTQTKYLFNVEINIYNNDINNFVVNLIQ